MWSSVFENVDPSNLRGFLLEGNKDHLLYQARSDLTKQLHVESLNACIGELQRHTKEHYKTHNTDLWNQDENKFDNKNCL